MGDVIHAIPAASALRDTFPTARIDWAIEPKWMPLLDRNQDISNIVAVDRKSAGGIWGTIRTLRAAHYDCVIDFQALYKSAILAYASRAPKRIGFTSSYAREGFASYFYTHRFNPSGPHKIDHNLTLARHAGAGNFPLRFPISIRPDDEKTVAQQLSARQLTEFFVLNPGGGWRSKCWPASRYGELHRKLAEKYGWRGIVTYGPGEENLAREVVSSAGEKSPEPILLGLGELKVLMRRAKFVVSADTGPLHLACALGTPVVGLYGPTDPARNGPFSREDVVVRNPRNTQTTYRRGDDFSPSMLSITVDQVFDAVVERMRRLEQVISQQDFERQVERKE
jgi:ADP-heptose:LPS heptosyltransferase